MGYATGRYLCHAHLQRPFKVEVSMVRKVFTTA